MLKKRGGDTHLAVDPHIVANKISEELRKDKVLPKEKRRSFREIREAVLTDFGITNNSRAPYRSAIGVILGSRPKRRRFTPRQKHPLLDPREGLSDPEDDSWFIVTEAHRYRILVCSGHKWEFICHHKGDGAIVILLNMPKEINPNDIPFAVLERVKEIARSYFHAKRRRRVKRVDPRQKTLF